MADTGRKLVVICIPVYKSSLSETEKVSLAQLNRILGKYPRCFVAPESLQFAYGQDGGKIAIERFPDYYFRNIKGYSSLLLDVAFYKRFVNYEYMLIYQLDAFVFQDELEYFCHMGYDYIGAPIARINSLWQAIGARVGNGGFSLRRISSAIRALERWFSGHVEHPLQNLFWQAEDLFWGYCGVTADFHFRVPAAAEALAFAVQDNVGHAFQKIAAGWHPFGCHAWCKDNRSFWQPCIESCGYVLGAPPQKAAYALETGWLLDYLRSRGNVNMCLLWGRWRKADYEAAAELLAKWLAAYGDDAKIWQGKTESLAYLWLMTEAGEMERGKKVRLQLAISRALLLALDAEEPAARLWYVLLSVAIHLAHYDYAVADDLRRRIQDGFWAMWESNAVYAPPVPQGGRKLTVITAVRDEAEVLESFVRHTLSFAGSLVVDIRLASRRAARLLEQLQGEGLPLKLVREDAGRQARQADASLVLALEPYDFLLPNQPGKSVGQILAEAGKGDSLEVPVFACQVWMGRAFDGKFLLARPLLRELAAGKTALLSGGRSAAPLPLHIARFAASGEQGRYAGRIPCNMEFVEVSHLVVRQILRYEKNL